MKTAALIAVAGLASAASAQVVVHLNHNDADGVIVNGETVTWTLSVSFGTGDGTAVSGGNMAITSNSLGTSSAFAYNEFGDGLGFNGGTNGGTASANGGITFVSFTNSLFLEAFGGDRAITDNPIVIGTFDFTATVDDGDVSMAVVKGIATSPFVSVDVSAFAANDFLEPGDISGFDIDALAIRVPTPASAALLGLGGLVATRRRR